MSSIRKMKIELKKEEESEKCTSVEKVFSNICWQFLFISATSSLCYSTAVNNLSGHKMETF